MLNFVFDLLREYSLRMVHGEVCETKCDSCHRCGYGLNNMKDCNFTGVFGRKYN